MAGNRAVRGFRLRERMACTYMIPMGQQPVRVERSRDVLISRIAFRNFARDAWNPEP